MQSPPKSTSVMVRRCTEEIREGSVRNMGLVASVCAASDSTIRFV
jgi:hypothetical protein